MRIDKNVLEGIMEAQQKLDKAILENAGIFYYPLAELIIAYNVELAELAQEWKGFKYWKKNKGEVDRSKLMEEYADCLHFAVSLTNHYIETSAASKRFLEAFLSTITEVIETKPVAERFIRCFDTDRHFEGGALLLIDTLRLGEGLGFTLEEVEEAYYYKNRINWERLRKGY